MERMFSARKTKKSRGDGPGLHRGGTERGWELRNGTKNGVTRTTRNGSPTAGTTPFTSSFLSLLLMVVGQSQAISSLRNDAAALSQTSSRSQCDSAKRPQTALPIQLVC